MKRILSSRWLAALLAASLGVAAAVAPQVPALAGSSATQTTNVTVTAPCTLSVSLTSNTVSFGSISAGSTTNAADLGAVQWGSTCNAGTSESWTGSIAATDLVAAGQTGACSGSADCIPAAGIVVTPSTTFTCPGSGCGTSAVAPSAGSGGSLAFGTGCADSTAGSSYTCPVTLATATAGTTTLPATWQQGSGTASSDNTATLAVPGTVNYVSFSGYLQYTITG